VRGEALLTRRKLRCKDGSLITSEINTRRVGSRIQAVIRDVTERDLFEEHRRSVQRLEALGLLAGSVAHDFNNFLLAIQANVELALNEIGDVSAAGADAIRSELEDIRRVARRAASLTRQLLTFSRKQSRPPATFPLGHAVTEIEQMLRLLIRPTVELVIRGAEGSGYVRADLGQLEQVVMNLVVNARDAMPNGGQVTIEVATRSLAAPAHLGINAQRVPPGDYVVLSVSDTGTGMGPETAARVFEPLFTTKAEGTGTGLGLWTVNAIVTQADGYVTVDSTPGVGSRFEVWLPEAEPPLAGAEPPADLALDTAQRR
jgi:two-component system, cell cycle sensor histidine kinase and response regulator CckA